MTIKAMMTEMMMTMTLMMIIETAHRFKLVRFYIAPVRDDDRPRFVESRDKDVMSAWWCTDIQWRDAADERIGPVQLTVVQRHAVDDVVDAVELGRCRVRQSQRVYRFAVAYRTHRMYQQVLTIYVNSAVNGRFMTDFLLITTFMLFV